MREYRSWRTVARIVATLAAAVLLFEASLCGDSNTSDPADAVRIQVTLINLDTANIHILVGDENFAEGAPPQGNRLGPGLSRNAEVGPFRVGDARAFSAGRDGEIFRTVSCPVTSTSFNSKAARVEWRLDQQLRCVGW